ncbi:MAG TPA: DNA polymerase III subunit gamma/tau, partial [Ruminococcaceae bacterium]|nr:DNA polymerase III subunit gamma/tau [Oscillospiraceae bacterium]
MSHLVFYRSFRPQTFDDVIGQDHIIKTLKNQVSNQSFGHAYLFCGTRGTGKTSTAKIFARAINCEHNINGSPCGKCPACLSNLNGGNLDIVEIDAASNNRVDEIRDLREKIGYLPSVNKYKVYIVDEVHMLTDS